MATICEAWWGQEAVGQSHLGKKGEHRIAVIRAGMEVTLLTQRVLFDNTVTDAGTTCKLADASLFHLLNFIVCQIPIDSAAAGIEEALCIRFVV